MSRPGFVLNVDHATPPILFWRGEQLTTEKLPAGSRVVYAPESSPALEGPAQAVRESLVHPLLGEPLAALLRPGMRLTIAFDDSSYPLLNASGVDSRRLAAEAVLEIAAETGVDDVVLVAARGLRRRMTERELRRALGDRVYESFAPKGLLTQHDAETPEGLAEIGKTDDGNSLQVNKRVAESDLLIFISISLTAADTGWNKIATALAGRQSLGDGSTQRVSAIAGQLSENVKTFQIDATVDTTQVPESLSFLNRREREWRVRDKVRFAAAREITALAPGRIDRRIWQNAATPNVITGVFAGDVNAVGKTVAAKLQAESCTPVNGQSDIVTFGVPAHFPFGPGSISNPVLATASALDLMFNLNEGTPVVRQGGVAILHHPMRPEFHTVNHPSYIDFFKEVLGDMDNFDKHEDRYATDPWYTQLYVNSYAFHGVHPFQVWRQSEKARKHLGGVIVVGGDTETVRRLGFKPASTFQDALEMARDITGSNEPTLTHMHIPPGFTVNVTK